MSDDAPVKMAFPKKIDSKEAYDSATLWAAWEMVNNNTSPMVELSLSERRALRRDKFKDLHEISKLRLVIDEISQEYLIDMSRYKFIK